MKNITLRAASKTSVLIHASLYRFVPPVVPHQVVLF
jgi:hypothetical protein